MDFCVSGMLLIISSKLTLILLETDVRKEIRYPRSLDQFIQQIS